MRLLNEMEYVSFASGSGGNCALVREGDGGVLIDAGISLRRIKAGLARQGLTLGDLDGILITHEHGDHVAALPMLLKYSDLTVYATRTVANRLLRSVLGLEDRIAVVGKEEPFSLGNMRITPFSTSHDTDESVGYRLEGENILGFCTDTGCVTPAMLAHLTGCGTVLLEANHDLERLRYGPYPVYLKRRILSDRGHLSNDACGELCCALAERGTARIALGHLSRENNTPDRAYSAVREALDGEGFRNVRLAVAPEDGDLIIEVEPCCACN